MLLPRFCELAPYVPGLSIGEIREKYGLEQVIKLASNENPLGASPLAQAAIKRCASSAFRYPQGGNPRLRKALARLHAVAEERLIIGNGSDELIDLLMRMTSASGVNNIAVFKPCFGIYSVQAEINGTECRRQPLEPDFSFNFQKLLALVDASTSLVFITTPDNPSGYCPAQASVRKFAQDLAQKAPGALLVIDEAYIDFAPDETEASLLASGSVPENVIFLRTLSKSYGLAGARLGYGIAPPQIAQAFWASRLPFSVNILAEEAALAAIADTAFRQATLATVKAGRQFLTAGLTNLGCSVWPSAANFLMFSLPGRKSASACHNFLLSRGIIIRPLTSYGLPDNLRVSIGKPEENRSFLQALREFLEQ